MNSDLLRVERIINSSLLIDSGIKYSDKPKNTEERNQTILYYLPVIDRVLKRYFLHYPFKHHIGIDDLFQEGVFIITRIIERFQPKTENADDELRGYLYSALRGGLRAFISRYDRLTVMKDHSKDSWKNYLETVDNFYEEEEEIDRKIFKDWLDLKRRGIGEETMDVALDKNQERIKKILNQAHLTNREKKILDFRFGLNGKRLTFQGLCDFIGLSRSTIFRAYHSGIRKLVSSNAVFLLNEFKN